MLVDQVAIPGIPDTHADRRSTGQRMLQEAVGRFIQRALGAARYLEQQEQQGDERNSPHRSGPGWQQGGGTVAKSDPQAIFFAVSLQVDGVSVLDGFPGDATAKIHFLLASPTELGHGAVAGFGQATDRAGGAEIAHPHVTTIHGMVGELLPCSSTGI